MPWTTLTLRVPLTTAQVSMQLICLYYWPIFFCIVNSQLGSVEPLTAISAQRPLKFRTEYHPFIGREPLHQAFNEFDIDTHPEEQLPVNKEPWCPFCSCSDFEFAEITLDAALNKSHINGLLSLIGRISRGETQMMLKSDSDLQKAWEHATNQATPVCLNYWFIHRIYYRLV